MTLDFLSSPNFLAIKPEVLIAFFGLAVLLFDYLLDERDKYLNAVMALIGLGFAELALFMLGFVAPGSGLLRWLHLSTWFHLRFFPPDYSGFYGSFALDAFSLVVSMVIVLATAIVVLISVKYLEIESCDQGEYFALLLFAAVGMMFMVSGTDLVTLFVALEVMALCEYVLTGFLRSSRRSNEAAVKFLLLGAFSSGLLVYGMSLLYGIGGSTKLMVIAERLRDRPAGDPLSWIALITLTAGMFFKIAAVPFHQWTPDAYEGAPTSITAFISVAPKVASFAFIIRILFMGLWPLRVEWQALTIGVAIATMTVGNLAAITQDNIKRFFGYSAISHVGYLLLGLVAAADNDPEGLRAIVIYLIVYALMNLGAFSVIIMMRRMDIIGEDIDDLSGLMTRAPAFALLMLIFLLSLAGIPPTAGFIGKYFIFLSLIQTGHYYLAVLGVVYAVVALYYYFRIVVVMFTKKALDDIPYASGWGLRVALGVCAALTLLIGIYPQPIIQIASEAVRPFFS